MKRRSIALLAMFAIAATAALFVTARIIFFGSAPLADPANARQVTLGQTVYRDQCARCHGANLEGQPDWQRRKLDGRLPAPPHDTTGHTWHHPDSQLFAITKDGLVPPIAPEGYQSDMPGFGHTLSDEDIWAVLAYIKSRWPADIRQRQQQIDSASRAGQQ